MKKLSKGTVFTIVASVLGLMSYLGYFWLIKTPMFGDFEKVVQNNLSVFFVFTVFFKVLSVLWPPLPGSLFTIAAIPFYGWQMAYFTDFLGSIIGSSIAFYLGRKYGIKFMKKIFEADIEAKINKLKIRPGREIESIFVLRMIGGGIIVEAVCYGAGLLKIKYTDFIIGSVLSHLAFGIPMFLLSDQILAGKNIVVTTILAIFSILILFKVKGRYLE